MQHQKYPKYKTSSIAWLDNIPEHWQLRRLRFSAPLQNHKSTTKSDELAYIGLEHIEPGTGKLLDTSNTSEVESSVSLFQTGDVLFNKLRPYLAKVHLAQHPGTCTSELLVLRPAQDIWSRFLFYYLLSDPIIRTVDSFTYGAKMPRVNWEQIADLPVAVATLSEQQTIVDFLDRETATIDTLIAKKQQLIQALQKQRMALISHAVTKGLDPNARMKESGVEWLGEVPVHWQALQLRRLKCLVQTGPFGSQLHAEDYVDNGYPVVNPANISDGVIIPDRQMTISEQMRQKLSRHVLQIGDIVVGRRGELGRAALVGSREEGWLCGTGSMLLRLLDERLLPEFLAIYIRLQLIRDYLIVESVGSTMDNLNAQIIYRMPLIIPPIKEQHKIVTHCNQASRLMDHLMLRIEAGTKKLQNYRTSLISSAVTGKIDVRNR